MHSDRPPVGWQAGRLRQKMINWTSHSTSGKPVGVVVVVVIYDSWDDTTDYTTRF
jgi:hypothetical protein